MTIDAHAHYEPRLMNEQQLLQMMKSENLDHMVLVPHLTDPPEPAKPAILMSIQRWMFSFDLLRPLAIWITQQMYKTDGKWNLGPLSWFMSTKESSVQIVLKPQNSLINSLVQKYPQYFSQWLFVNPRLQTVQEIEDHLKSDPGIIGLKLHPFWHKFSLSEFLPFAHLARKFNLPINIHLGHESEEDIKHFISENKDLTLIFGHLGVPLYKALWRNIIHQSNCYLDLSSTYHVDERLLRNALKVVGPDRILFASDTPYTAPGSIGLITGWISKLPITREEKDLILFKNYKKILKK